MNHGFPGGTSVTHVTVYDSMCPDGLVGGTPHLHTASTEAYVVVEGRGALHTLDLSGLQQTTLEPGTVVWFTPGTIHRAVNHGGLRLVVVMANAGLPEAGDAVMTFPPEIVADPDRYRNAASLPHGEPDAVLDEAVHKRRGLAVAGFQRLVDATNSGDPGPLERFYDDAAALVRPLASEWRQLWQETVASQTDHTATILDALARGDGQHLRAATRRQAPPSPTLGFGMCGRLRTYDTRNA